MKKRHALFVTLALLAGTGLGAQTPAVKDRPALLNGEFREIVPVAEKDKSHVGSAEFPKYWSVYGGGLVKTPDGKNAVGLENYLYTLLRNGSRPESVLFSGGVTASGKGKLKVYLSGCIRKPGDKRPFGNELTPVLGEFSLSETPRTFKIEYQTEPHSTYYLEFKQKGGKALIHSVNFEPQLPAGAKK